MQNKTKRIFQVDLVRDESYNAIKIINNKGTPILNGADRKTRWKELYNPNIMTDQTYEAKDVIEP